MSYIQDDAAVNEKSCRNFVLSPELFSEKSVSYDMLKLADKKSTAAGILLWALKDGVPHVLLGLRSDNNCWCNMGGSSEKSDVFLFVTASREVSEETVGIYSISPEKIVDLPYCDFVAFSKRKKTDLLYRMYIAQCRMVSEKILAEKLKKAKGHCREYSKFKWIPMEDLLKSAESQSKFYSDLKKNACSAKNFDSVKLKKFSHDNKKTIKTHLENSVDKKHFLLKNFARMLAKKPIASSMRKIIRNHSTI